MVHLSSLLLLSLLIAVVPTEGHSANGVSSNWDYEVPISKDEDPTVSLLSGNGVQKRGEGPSIPLTAGYLWKRDEGPSIRRQNADYSWKKRSMREKGDPLWKRSNEPVVRRAEQYIWKKRSDGSKWMNNFHLPL